MAWAPLDFGMLLLLLLPSISGDPGCFDTPDTGRCCVSGADIASADSPRPLPPPPSAHFSGSCGFLAGVSHYCPLTLRLRRASGVAHGTPSLPARKAPLAIVNFVYSTFFSPQAKRATLSPHIAHKHHPTFQWCAYGAAGTDDEA